MGASESKLAFKEDVFRLAGEDNIPAGSDWWDKVSTSLSFRPSKLHSAFASLLAPKALTPLLLEDLSVISTTA